MAQKWECVCGYIYNPAEGAEGITPGTAFEDLPDDWLARCMTWVRMRLHGLKTSHRWKTTPRLYRGVVSFLRNVYFRLKIRPITAPTVSTVNRPRKIRPPNATSTNSVAITAARTKPSFTVDRRPFRGP